jgi:hypothetical protein
VRPERRICADARPWPTRLIGAVLSGSFGRVLLDREAFLDEIADASLPPDGAATQLMLALARRHRAVVGGSFICRDATLDGRGGRRLSGHGRRVKHLEETSRDRC